MVKKLFVIALCTTLLGCNIEVDVEGQGYVFSDPEWINCRENSGTCKVKNYERLNVQTEDLIVTFRARPDKGHRLVGWEGDCDEKVADKCRVALGDDVRVKARFEPINYAAGLGDTSQTIRFIAIGDTGTAETGQYQVAQAIEQWCLTRSCDFVLGLGDNFYDVTPSSAHDPVFNTHFEEPYKNIDLPFYMVLGNHDTGRYSDGDGGDQSKGEYQVQYSQRSDRVSNKFTMPSRYYSFLSAAENTSAPLVHMIAIDSAPFVGAFDNNNAYAVDQYAQTQGQWLLEQYQNSTAVWKIAFAHHPYVSNGKHGNASNYDGAPRADGVHLEKLNGEIYRRFMEQYVCEKVDWYLSGHDHNLQALSPVAPCGSTQFVVSGAGSKANALHRPNDNAVYFQQGNTIGFMYFEITGNRLEMTAVSAVNGSPQTIYNEIHDRVSQ